VHLLCNIYKLLHTTDYTYSGGGRTMKHLVARNWDESNRSENLEKILSSLNRSGKAEVEFFKGRPYFIRVLVGRGNPKVVYKDDKWNMVRINYQGKDAVELFYSGVGYEGYLFDENFTEAECGQVIIALDDGGFLTWESAVSGRKKWIKLFTTCGVLIELVSIINYSLKGNMIGVILSSGVLVGFVLIFCIMIIWK
jgi:hypothetical protein